jgi:hypothetical protein
LIYRELRRQKARKIVEFGIGAGQRAVNLIELLKEFHDVGNIHYTGIDLFEARAAADGPGLSLRDAHRLLKPTGARVQLVPGTPVEALARVANGLKDVDAVIISAQYTLEQMLPAWFYLPRMTTAATRFFQESTSATGTAVRVLTADEIARFAAQGQRRAA